MTKERCDESQLFERAQKVASQYRLTLAPTEHGHFIGSSVELPLVIAMEAESKVIPATRHAIAGALVQMLKRGRELPLPVGSRRDIQINVRVSVEERELLDNAARTRGYRGISDYIRSTAIENSKQR